MGSAKREPEGAEQRGGGDLVVRKRGILVSFSLFVFKFNLRLVEIEKLHFEAEGGARRDGRR